MNAVSTVQIPVATRLSFNDYYLKFLGFTLIGYAFLGRGFAYLGFGSLFVGEIALIIGTVVLFRTNCLLALAATPRIFGLCCLFVWGMTRAVPYVGPHGIDTLRDSVLIGYGLFAFIVAALILERPARLKHIVEAYARFAWIYGLVGGYVYLITATTDGGLKIPGTGLQFPALRAGEAAVHLAGCAIFMMLGLGRAGIPWMIGLVVSIAMVTPNRAAIISCFLPIALAATIGGKLSKLAPAILIAGSILIIAYALGLKIDTPGGRGVGPSQFFEALGSIFGESKASNFDGTKEWRLQWWNEILKYTFSGPYFWNGKGFGINLAISDGFLVGDNSLPLLRSPHNSHLTILARTGVPGLTIWMLTLSLWFLMLARSMYHARFHGQAVWANFFLWLACYFIAILINASFDVSLESPMLGIWFWCLFGLGIGADMIYRFRFVSQSRLVDQGSRNRHGPLEIAD